MWRMRQKHCITWNMARNTEKREKRRNIHCKTWNMTRILKNRGKRDTNDV